uniref:Uncharacterized protein n=1 Tax=Timema bartmani TaxID=61472 RepID=A0A7R9ERA6_9NEOP|nr:unnamed protein product [Timema bartmani]
MTSIEKERVVGARCVTTSNYWQRQVSVSVTREDITSMSDILAQSIACLKVEPARFPQSKLINVRVYVRSITCCYAAVASLGTITSRSHHKSAGGTQASSEWSAVANFGTGKRLRLDRISVSGSALINIFDCLRLSIAYCDERPVVLRSEKTTITSFEYRKSPSSNTIGAPRFPKRCLDSIPGVAIETDPRGIMIVVLGGYFMEEGFERLSISCTDPARDTTNSFFKNLNNDIGGHIALGFTLTIDWIAGDRVDVSILTRALIALPVLRSKRSLVPLFSLLTSKYFPWHVPASAEVMSITTAALYLPGMYREYLGLPTPE